MYVAALIHREEFREGSFRQVQAVAVEKQKNDEQSGRRLFQNQRETKENEKKQKNNDSNN